MDSLSGRQAWKIALGMFWARRYLASFQVDKGAQVASSLKMNSDIGNASFDEKKTVIGKSSFVTIASLAKCKNWTAESVAERQKQLADLAVKTWSLLTSAVETRSISPCIDWLTTASFDGARSVFTTCHVPNLLPGELSPTIEGSSPGAVL